MKFSLTKILTLILIFSASTASRNAYANVVEDLESPFTTPARTVFLVGAATTTALILLQRQIDIPLQKSVVASQPLGGLNKIGDYGGRMIPNGLYAAGMLAAHALHAPGAWEHFEVMALGSIYAVSWSTLLKYTTGEPRPNASDKKSFPSGHATSAFSFASVVGAEHGWQWGVPAYALAAMTGLSRMNTNNHYLHDVIAGFTIGASYGLGIHFLHGLKSGASASNKETAPSLVVAPVDDGAVMIAKLRF